MRLRRPIILALWLTLFVGCASVTFKRGATPGDSAADERACRDANPDANAYNECMRQRGWFISGPGAAPDRVATHTPIVQPKASDGAAAVVDTPAARTAATAPPAARTPTASPSTKAAAPPASEAPSAADPLAPIQTGSWWKLGGNATDLDRAINVCVAKLGNAHRPQPGATVVTVGLRDCLRQAGWYTLKGSANVP